MADLDFSVLLDDLTADGTQWADLWVALGTIHTSVLEGCALDSHVLDGLSFAQGLKTYYDRQFQDYVAFFDEGLGYLGSLKPRLDDARTAYEASEEYQQWQAETGG